MTLFNNSLKYFYIFIALSLSVSCFGFKDVGENALQKHAPVFYYKGLGAYVNYSDISVALQNSYEALKYDEVSKYFPRFYDYRFLGFSTKDSRITMKFRDEELVNDSLESLLQKKSLSQTITIGSEQFKCSVSFSKSIFEADQIGKYDYYMLDVIVKFVGKKKSE